MQTTCLKCEGGRVRRQVLYLTLTSWLDKRTENADRERLAQAEKDRRASRLLPSSVLCADTVATAAALPVVTGCFLQPCAGLV